MKSGIGVNMHAYLILICILYSLVSLEKIWK